MAHESDVNPRRFEEDDDAYLNRLEAEAGAWLRSSLNEVNVIRQLEPGDVVVFRLTGGDLAPSQRAVAMISKQLQQLRQSPGWEGIKIILLPSFVELMGVKDDRPSNPASD